MKVELKNVASIFNGKTPSKAEQREAGFPVLKIKDIDENGFFKGKFDCFVDQELADGLLKKHVQAGDILILNAAHNSKYVGSKKCFVSEDFAGALATGEWTIVRPTQDKVLPKFLYFILDTAEFQFELQNVVKGIHLYPKDLNEIKIFCPSLEEQKRIVRILDQADFLRQKRQKAISLLDDYLKAVFLEMFGNLFTNTKNWKYEDFGNYIDVLTDYHANGSYEILQKNVTLLSEPDYALMVRTTDLEKNDFVSDVKYIDKHAYNFLEKSKIFGGEIIINKIGSAGKVYLMPHLNRPVSLGMNAFMLRFNSDMNVTFLYYLLTSQYGEAIIQKKVKGAVTKTIRKDAIRGLRIPIVPIGTQNKFADIVQNIERLKQSMLTQSEELDTHFNARMQEAFA